MTTRAMCTRRRYDWRGSVEDLIGAAEAMRLRGEKIVGAETPWTLAARVRHGQGKFSVSDVASLRARVGELAKGPHPITRISLTWRVPRDRLVVTVDFAPKLGLAVIAEHGDYGFAEIVADAGISALELSRSAQASALHLGYVGTGVRR